jgi:membrane associated rhomboid family serine protease
MPAVTAALLIANVIVFGAQQIWGEALKANFALWPLGRFEFADGVTVGFEPWQLLTSAFLHENTLHILFNMFALYMFGGTVERYLGRVRYATLYFAAVLSSAVTQLIVVSRGDEPVGTIGASGGVFGLLLAFGWLFPRARVTLIFPPIPMPAWVFVTLYGIVELGSGVLGTQSGVAHFAHLGGMVGAFILLVLWRVRRPVIQ